MYSVPYIVHFIVHWTLYCILNTVLFIEQCTLNYTMNTKVYIMHMQCTVQHTIHCALWVWTLSTTKYVVHWILTVNWCNIEYFVHIHNSIVHCTRNCTLSTTMYIVQQGSVKIYINIFYFVFWNKIWCFTWSLYICNIKNITENYFLKKII